MKKFDKIVVAVVAIACLGANFAKAGQDVPWGENLVKNPYGTTFDGWDKTDGGNATSAWACGSHWSSSYVDCTLSQIIKLEDFGFTEWDLDSDCSLLIGASCYVRANGSSNSGKVGIYAYFYGTEDDIDRNRPIKTVTIYNEWNNRDEWVEHLERMLLPIKTRYIKLEFVGKANMNWADQYGPQFDDANVTLYKGEVPSLKIEYVSNGPGTILGPVLANKGDTIECEPIPNSQCYFEKISVISNDGIENTIISESARFVMPDGNVKIEAAFTEICDFTKGQWINDDFETYSSGALMGSPWYQIGFRGDWGWRCKDGGMNSEICATLLQPGSGQSQNERDWFFRPVILEGGMEYSFSFWAKGNGLQVIMGCTKEPMSWGEMQELGGSGESVFNSCLNTKSVNVGSDWSQYSMSFTPQETGQYWIGMLSEQNSKDNDICIDNVVLKKTNGVSSIATEFPSNTDIGLFSVDKTSADCEEIVTVTCEMKDASYEPVIDIKVGGGDVPYTQVKGADEIYTFTFSMPSSEPTIKGEFLKKGKSVSLDNLKNGSIAIAQKQARPGTIVSFSVEPNVDYTIGNVFCRKNANGGNVEVTFDPSTNKYSFEMPDDDVLVGADFNRGKRLLTLESKNENGIMQNAISSVAVKATGAIAYEVFSESEYMAYEDDSIRLTYNKAPDGCVLSYITLEYNNYEQTLVFNVTEGGEVCFKMPFETVKISSKYKRLRYTALVESCDHGSFSLSNKYPYEGETVNVIPNPYFGYTLDTIIVVNATTMQNIQVSANSFVMPGSNVRVKCVFKELYSAVASRVEFGDARQDNGDVDENEQIQVTTLAEKGTLIVSSLFNDKKIKQGERVRLKTRRCKGYEIKNLYVENKQAAYKQSIGLDSSFIMPGFDVTIICEYMEAIRQIRWDDKDLFKDQKNTAREGEYVNLKINVPEGKKALMQVASNGIVLDSEMSDNILSFEMPYGNVEIKSELAYVSYHAYCEMPINIVFSLKHGANEIDGDYNLHKGDVVSVDYSPRNGYEIDLLSVADANGNSVIINEGKFLMPASNVTVTVSEKESVHMLNVEPPFAGSFNLETQEARGGSSFELNYKETNGYSLKNIRLNGKDIKKNEDGIYAFTMPYGDATIKAEEEPVIKKITLKSTFREQVTEVSSSIVYDANSKDTVTDTMLEKKYIDVQVGGVINVSSRTTNSDYMLSSIQVVADGILYAESIDSCFSFVMPNSNVVEIQPIYKKTPHKIYLKESEGGIISVSVGKALLASENDEVEVFIERNKGYELNFIQLTQMSDNKSQIVKNNKFSMPASDVEVEAVFKEAVRKIDVDFNENMGDVEVAKDAQEGQHILLQSKAKDGFYVESITVSTNEEVLPFNNVDGGIEFEMPYGDVSAKIVFGDVTPTVTVSSYFKYNITNNDSVVTVIAEFSKKVIGLSTNGLVTKNCSAIKIETDDSLSYKISVSPQSEGIFTVGVSKGAASDLYGTKSSASNILSLTLDRMSPSVSLSEYDYDKKRDFLVLKAKFDEPVLNFSDSCVKIGNTLRCGRVYDMTTTDSMEFIFKADHLFEGSNIFYIGNNVVTDKAGNGNLASREVELLYFIYDPLSEEEEEEEEKEEDNPGAINDKVRNDIFVYPNPAREYIIVEVENKEDGFIEILDVSGKVLKSQTKGSDLNKVYINGFQQGIYYARMVTDTNVSVVRFVKD